MALPEDKSYMECGLPPYLRSSLDNFILALARAETDKNFTLLGSCWMELNSSINVAEVEQEIDNDRAWYLREKYLGMER